MVEVEESRLGNALTVLGLEDKFLENGELSSFPLVERGRIANSIIAEKLRLGRWETVVMMIYGGFGKADALFEGDRDQLREEILNSVIKHYKSGRYTEDRTLEALAKSGEDDLLFRIATNIPSLNYEEFMGIINKIGSSYFRDPDYGSQRKYTMHEIAARKALAEKDYHNVLSHSRDIDNKTALTELFNLAMTHKQPSSLMKIAEEIALSDPEQKQSRLRRIILSSCAKEISLDSVKAFELFKKHKVTLSDEERALLYDKVAEEAKSYHLRHELIQDQELSLLWAKKHVKSEPKTAYGIFSQQDYNGTHVINAVLVGLGSSKRKRDDEALEVREVSEDHLRRAYNSASFNVKVKIATHLKDSKELQKLSKQAFRSEDLRTAYYLWVSGGGNLEGKYITNIRTQLINDRLNEGDGTSMHFFDRSDKIGRIQVYEALMQQQSDKKNSNLIDAYEIALMICDEERTQRVRELMVEVSPRWALKRFSSGVENKRDEKGIEYVLSVVAKKHSVEEKTLRHFVEKYRSN